MKQAKSTPFEVWNEQQLSEVIDVPVATLRSMRSRGGGPPFIKIGRAVRYVPRHIDVWLDEQMRTHSRDI